MSTEGLLIRELEAAATPADAHLLPIDQGGDAKKLTLSQMAGYIASKNIGSIFGLPVGSVFYNPSTSAADVRGCVRGDDGGYYETATATIPDLYAWAKGHPDKCKTKEEYDALYALNGFVDYYVVDEVAGSLRLPKYTKLTVKENLKWADRVAFVNNTAAPFDCIAVVGVPANNSQVESFLTPKDASEFQLSDNGYSNTGPTSVTVRLSAGDKLRVSPSGAANGWWVPIECQTLNLIPWIVAKHQETPEAEIALLSITSEPSGTFAAGSKYFNSSDSLIYTAITPNTWTGATTDAPVFSVAYLFGGNFYLWTGSGLMLRPAEGGGSGGGTAGTTSFEPTATITSNNVQDAIEEVDGKVQILSESEYDAATKSESKLYAVKKFSYSTNFTTVGTPTIDENLVISGFTPSNYLHLIPSVLSLGVSTREMIFKIKVSDDYQWQPLFSSEGRESTLEVGVSESKAKIIFWTGSTAYNGTTLFSNNDIVWIKFNYNSSTGYTCHTFKDNGQLYNLTNLPSLSSWTEEFTTDYNIDILNTTTEGKGNYIGNHSNNGLEYFYGSVYLLDTIIYENGSVKWQPYSETFKGFIQRVGAKPLLPEFEPTATITSDNVQAAIEEVDAKAEAVAGELADTEINGVAIAGKDNTCDDLGLQCAINAGNNISKTQISESAVKLLLKFTTADGFQDISASPLTFSFSGTPIYGDPLFANSTNQSLRLRGYDDFHVNKPAEADWSKINIGTGPFTIKFRRKCSSAAYSGQGKLLSINNTASSYNSLYISGSISALSTVQTTTPVIPIVENAIEEILLTRLENGLFEYYKNGTKLGTSEALNGIPLDFSDWGYGFCIIMNYGTEDYISGLVLENKAYTGGNYTPSEDYPTSTSVSKDVIACKNYFGEIYTADNTTAQTIPTGATYTKATAFNTAGEYRGVTIDAVNNKIILPSAGYYKVGVTASSKLGSAGITLKTALFLGGVKVPNCQSIRKINNANDENTVSFGGIVKVDTANSDIDVRVSHDNGGDVSLTTIFCNLNAVYIGDLTL